MLVERVHLQQPSDVRHSELLHLRPLRRRATNTERVQRGTGNPLTYAQLPGAVFIIIDA